MWPETASDKHFCSISLSFHTHTHTHTHTQDVFVGLASRWVVVVTEEVIWMNAAYYGDMCSDLGLEVKRLNIQSAHGLAKPLLKTKNHNKLRAESIDVNEETSRRRPQSLIQMEEEARVFV